MSDPQNMVALKKGNKVKDVRAELRAELRHLGSHEARALAASMLEAVELDEGFGAIKVRLFLTLIPSLGEGAADVLLREINVRRTAMTCRVRELTVRQREKLAELLRGSRERWGRAA